MRRPVSHSLAIPGSKSLVNRALLLAGVAQGQSILDQAPDSGDIQSAISALAGLGIACESPHPGRWIVSGNGLHFPCDAGDLNIGSSGTVGRFLTGLLAAAPHGSWRLVASGQLSRRPLGPLVEALRRWGAVLEPESEGRAFPLRIAGTGLRGGDASVSAALSSQFASGMLMAAPLASTPSRIDITGLDPEECYIDLTLELMGRFGVHSESRKYPGGQTVRIVPQSYRPADLVIEADFNSAIYFLALPLLVGGRIGITNLSLASGQPGRKFLAVLSRLGGEIGESGGQLVCTGSGLPLKGGFAIDMRAMSEMALTLGVLAVFADAPVTMTNLAHIRGHETDRLTALAQTLQRVGARSESGPDRITIFPAEPGRPLPAVIDSLDDHRIAMSFALLGLAGNGLTIRNPRAVDKTFPAFFQRLAECGAEVEYS